MKRVWTVFYFELLLYWRGWLGWAIAVIMALFGWNIAPLVNLANPFLWEILCLSFGFLTLMLAFMTGNQIQRDHQLRMDGIIMSTAVPTTSFVLGKYLAQLLTILSYAAVALLALLGASLRTIGTPYFSPPLGPGVVTLIWLMLVPVPLIFVCVLMLFGISLLRGKRAFIFVLVLLIWIAPLALVDRISDVFNLPTPSLLILPASPQAPSNSLLRLDAAKRLYIEKLSNDGVLHFTPADWKELTHLYQSTVIPEHMTTTFLLNRGLFLALSILLFIGTTFILKFQRQGRL
ncbi:hypothetical protein KSF_098470 [Reticulibacter mediterranei]|uniref:Uncharacterized protein n=1 Tax=Reticulibacter mediterranei TaxID=2778369 RepID=A0A8J3IXM9_9CHLR|nr:hypothetical protein [Reticulibacter mediterranei]GHO99799.1 hypothetical protein KSF_098470 [Reticulibacter mediterranei]